MSDIQIQSKPSNESLTVMQVLQWPIWEKEVSSFPWKYEQTEVCFFLQGKVTVTPKGGQPVEMGEGDLVTFPKGLECHWQIHEPVKKHYNFTD